MKKSNNKKDILFTCQFFYPEYVSSATLPYDVAVFLSEHGYEVGALCGYPYEYNLKKEPIPKKENKKGIDIKRVKYAKLSRKSIIGRLINYLSFTFKMFLNIREFKKYRASVVYSNPPILPLINLIAKKLYGTKIIFVGFDIYPEMAVNTNSLRENGIIFKFMRFINKILYKNLDALVVLSEDMREFILKNRNISEYKIHIIPNWFDDEGYLEKNEKTSKFLVSYYGNMGICQDIETILKAIKSIDNKDIDFVLGGHGTKKDEIKKYIESEKLQNVQIKGFLHGEEYTNALANSDVLLVSLENNLCGLAVPSKTYSYMMSGKPIISIMSRKTELSQLIEDNSIGFAIENGDIANLVQKINFLYHNPDKTKSMGKNARKMFLDNYTKEISLTKYLDVIKIVLNE